MYINHALREYFGALANAVDVDESTKLVDVLDSLGFLDFFLFLEQSFPDSISLDHVVGCETVGDLSRLLDTSAPLAGGTRVQLVR